MRPRLMTSNPKKIHEFKRLGLDADMAGPSADLREPLSDPYFVCAHKAWASGAGALCEDTRLDVDGADIGILARFSMDKLSELEGQGAQFACCLALHTGTEVWVWEGSVDGRIGQPRSGGFGFDPFFYPHGAHGLCLGELDQAGRKDEFSARARACLAYLNEPPISKFNLADLEAFQGPWQDHPEEQQAPSAHKPSLRPT